MTTLIYKPISSDYVAEGLQYRKPVLFVVDWCRGDRPEAGRLEHHGMPSGKCTPWSPLHFCWQTTRTALNIPRWVPTCMFICSSFLI